MAILNIVTGLAGTTGVLPSIAYIATSDTQSTVLTAGYLNLAVQQGTSFSLPCMACVSTKSSPTAAADVGWYEIQHSGANWSLVPTQSAGSVTLPTIANHIATYTNTTGGLSEDPATAISAGNIQAGLSGTAGSFISFPSAAASGALVFGAVANSGNFTITVRNASMGQSTAISIPDPGNAAAQFVVGATATPFVSGNFPVASGTGGLMVDSGVAATNLMKVNAVNTMTGVGQIILAKANGTEAANAVTASGNAGVITTSALTTAGGATYVITWTNTLITSTSVIHLSIMGGTNTVQNITFKATAGSGTSTLTIFNNTAATALNGTILIGYVVL